GSISAGKFTLSEVLGSVTGTAGAGGGGGTGTGGAGGSFLQTNTFTARLVDGGATFTAGAGGIGGPSGPGGNLTGLVANLGRLDAGFTAAAGTSPGTSVTGAAS